MSIPTKVRLISSAISLMFGVSAVIRGRPDVPFLIQLGSVIWAGMMLAWFAKSVIDYYVIAIGCTSSSEGEQK